jgi:hypothetical protein
MAIAAKRLGMPSNAIPKPSPNLGSQPEPAFDPGLYRDPFAAGDTICVSYTGLSCFSSAKRQTALAAELPRERRWVADEGELLALDESNGKREARLDHGLESPRILTC